MNLLLAFDIVFHFILCFDFVFELFLLFLGANYG